jgi:hypothetical protein
MWNTAPFREIRLFVLTHNFMIIANQQNRISTEPNQFYCKLQLTVASPALEIIGSGQRKSH